MIQFPIDFKEEVDFFCEILKKCVLQLRGYRNGQ